MRRIPLHLLLAFSLIFNGFSAPWAMAHMSEDSHAGHDMQAQSSSHDGGGMSGKHMHGDSHSMDEDAHGDCCEGGNCHCGCLLPPVVAAVIIFALPRSVRADVVDATRPLALIARSHPPFRPPAV